MRIAIYNQKGGAGKTMLATQLALYFDATIIEVDPYGVLTHTLGNDMVVKIPLGAKIPSFKEGDAIYDFGGFDDERFDDIEGLDLIIIPSQPTINALGTSLKSYKRVCGKNVPVLFVINGYLNDLDVEAATEYLAEQLGDEVDYFSIPHTRALQTAENSAVSVVTLAEGGGLKSHTYKKIATCFNGLFAKVKEYL